MMTVEPISTAWKKQDIKQNSNFVQNHEDKHCEWVKEVMQWAEGEIGEIDSPCAVRFFTCPLPVLVICCQMLDMTLTERWRHHIGILPRRLPAALPPVCLHQRLTSSPRLSFPRASFLSFVTLFWFIVIPSLRFTLSSLTCSVLFLGTFYTIITLSSPPSNRNLHILMAERTWKSQLDLLFLGFPPPYR